MPRPRGRTFWTSIIGDLSRSGLPTAVFAARRGLNVHTLRYWSWRLRSEEEPPRVVELVPVDGAPPIALPLEPAGIEVHLRDVRLVLPPSMSPRSVAELVRELARC
jgi:hypothetical protein